MMKDAFTALMSIAGSANPFSSPDTTSFEFDGVVELVR
jgi:hypothetical protein